jgi:alginate O-acetyltransferase complex protein AlgI
MQFNSFEFIYVFLPVTLILFFSAAFLAGGRTAIAVLVIASLLYYTWWEPIYFFLMAGSILFNYAIGYYLVSKPTERRKRSRLLLIGGIGGNLVLLGYFKYANFFVENVADISGFEIALPPIILPIAISFFTFQQIAYLVDCYRREVTEYSFLNYVLFVAFFPQLLAGPIVHHREMMPQFADPSIYRARLGRLSAGLAIFGVGLLKKIVIADQIAHTSDAVFGAVHQGSVPALWEAWAGAAAFTFQLYFDFSAYSDMAIGLATMLGIALPLNFYSPYKAASIIDFWRRWHMTLSRFLRDYLYIPMGGSRSGEHRRYANILITMVIGGLWHGASWTFVCWGAYHGLLILLNHAWRAAAAKADLKPGRGGFVASGLAVAVTFGFVIIGWVFFRAETFGDAAVMLKGMFGASAPVADSTILTDWRRVTAWLLALLVMVWAMPNTYQIFSKFKPALLPEYLQREVSARIASEIIPDESAPNTSRLRNTVVGDAVQFIRARLALISLVLMIIAFFMFGVVFFSPGAEPNTFIYSIF